MSFGFTTSTTRITPTVSHDGDPSAQPKPMSRDRKMMLSGIVEACYFDCSTTRRRLREQLRKLVAEVQEKRSK
ncbi:hypothetical protein KIN20_029174 [Parelaphostrongylus tenuis]|uniref:Uncharacterized protein n=1 Tax=Parelaphostrongylus tenuis TaxID=148309 RepID=A0AAD5WFE1_PARTN|nr:hypothetical protein KIN20_029174 [Parelaphostrongylus tenuis]